MVAVNLRQDILRSTGAHMAEILVGTRADLVNGQRIIVRLADTEICVLDHGAALFAYENRCVHQGGPVGEGVVIGKVECVLDGEKRALGERFSTKEMHLVCPWHGWEFDLHTGKSVTNRGLGLRKFDVRLRGEDVYLDVPDEHV
jgi:nitrite reductase (NADH) small subunit